MDSQRRAPVPELRVNSTALVADLAAIRAHHTPGMPVASGHDDFLFRATRAHANTNESLAAFVVLSLAAMLLGASPPWTNGLTWGFALARVGHMAAYYGDQPLLRGVAFAVGFGCLVGLVVVGTRRARKLSRERFNERRRRTDVDHDRGAVPDRGEVGRGPRA